MVTQICFVFSKFKEVFEDLQKLEKKYYETCDERDNKTKELETVKKTWQLQTTKLKYQLTQQTELVVKRDRKIVELNGKLKKSYEDCNNKELEARTNYKKAVYAEGEVTKLMILLEKRDFTIETLQNKLSNVQNELNIYITMEAKLKGERENLQSEFTSSAAALEKFQVDLRMANKEIAVLNAKVSDYEQDLRRTKDRCEKLQSSNDTLRTSETKLKHKHNELEQDNIRMRNKIIELKKDLELALNRPTEKSYEVISVDNNVSNVVESSGSGDLFAAVDSGELERANHRIKELEDLLHHHEVETSDLNVNLGNYKGNINHNPCH